MTIPTTPGTPARARTPIATIIRRIAAISALAVTAFGLSVATASAGEPQQIRTNGGTVVFDDLGELVVAKDKRADGLSVMANLAWGKASATVVDDSGASGAGETGNLSIPEGTTVWLIMCYEVDGITVKCSDSQRGVA